MALLTITDDFAPWGGDWWSWSVWGDENFIYIGTYKYVTVYSLSSIGKLTEISYLWIGDYVNGITGNNGYIYVANDASGLKTYSVSELGILTPIDSHNPGGSMFKVWSDNGVSTQYLYTATGNETLHKYSVLNGILTHISEYDIDNYLCTGVWGYGAYVYRTGQSAASISLWIHNANDLSIADTVTVTGGIIGDDVWGNSVGNVVIFANNTAGIKSFSISSGILTFKSSHNPNRDPANYDDTCHRVHGNDNNVFVAGYEGGVHAYSLTNAMLTFVESHNDMSETYGIWNNDNFVISVGKDRIVVYKITSSSSYPKINYFNRIQPFILN